MPSLDTVELQSLCELGQQQLMETQYLAAEETLLQAERLALAGEDYDTLSRLYMPLQEARRQRRQRCGEGTVALNLIAQGPNDHLDPRHVVENFPHGQLLVAGWGSVKPAVELRRWQLEHKLFVETFLAAVYPAGSSRVIVIVPDEDVSLPSADIGSIDEIVPKLPAHSLVFAESELPSDSRRGTPQTYAFVCSIWERLHHPFLAAADFTVDPFHQIEAYRRALRVDYACELAHHRLSHTAHHLAREIARETRASSPPAPISR